MKQRACFISEAWMRNNQQIIVMGINAQISLDSTSCDETCVFEPVNGLLGLCCDDVAYVTWLPVLEGLGRKSDLPTGKEATPGESYAK